MLDITVYALFVDETRFISLVKISYDFVVKSFTREALRGLLDLSPSNIPVRVRTAWVPSVAGFQTLSYAPAPTELYNAMAY